MNEKQISTFELEKKLMKGRNNGSVNSDVQKHILQTFLSDPRDDESSQYYRDTAMYLTMKLGRLGFFVLNHNFMFTEKRSNHTRSGVNIAGVMPGVRWGTHEDSVILVTAHWDTVSTSPGVDDNGSGVVALLEAARIISSVDNNVLKNSVIYALVDKEEVGCEGSNAFVKDFIVPVIVERFGSKIQGVYNLDSISSYSTDVHSQDIDESWNDIDSGMVNKIIRNERRADFIMTIGRNVPEDTYLALLFLKYLRGFSSHHLKV